MENPVYDASSARVTKVIVHRVGNKAREEGVYLSPKEHSYSESIFELLCNNFLTPLMKQGQPYELFHESDISLNTVHHYASLIFNDADSFHQNSEAITKHLYSCSTHPNIGGGEFLFILFDDILIDNVTFQALGLFRVEDKSDYLDVREENGSIEIHKRLGISLEQIQKGAVVLSDNGKVFVVDALSKKTKYWIDDFLKAAPIQTPQMCAKATGALLKAVSDKVETPADALEFGRMIDESLSGADELSFSGLRDISSKFIKGDDMNEVLDGVNLKYGFDPDDDLRLQSRQLSRYAKDVVNKARIADGVNLYVSDRNTNINYIDVEQTMTGFRAVVDFEVKE